MGFTASICGAFGFINQLLPSGVNINTQNYSHQEKSVLLKLGDIKVKVG